jgi:hypothetical protein
MPVIIKELVITTTVDANAGQAQNTPSVSPTLAMQKDLIQKCVEQVLAILKEKTER